jgi:hypothetical protein
MGCYRFPDLGTRHLDFITNSKSINNMNGSDSDVLQVSDYEMKLMNLDQEHLGIPETGMKTVS